MFHRWIVTYFVCVLIVYSYIFLVISWILISVGLIIFPHLFRMAHSTFGLFLTILILWCRILRLSSRSCRDSRLILTYLRCTSCFPFSPNYLYWFIWLSWFVIIFILRLSSRESWLILTYLRCTSCFSFSSNYSYCFFWL